MALSVIHFVTLLACSLLLGCGGATTHVELTAKSPRPLRPVPPDRVSVLRTAPTVPYVEVAILRTREGTFPAKPGELIEKLRADAAKIGCDAVLVRGPTNEVTWIGNPPAAVAFEVYSGNCIVFVPPAGASSGENAPAAP